MSKKVEEVEIHVEEHTPQTNNNALLSELNSNGKVTLTAKTREELQEIAVALIKASEGKAYAAGGAGYDENLDMQVITIKIKEE